MVSSRASVNASLRQGAVRYLDAGAIETWILAALRDLAREANIVAIVPVAHGAAAAYVKGDRLVSAVLDYETEVPADASHAYQSLRDPFTRTLSPLLPNGLNLGQQLFWQEEVHPEIGSSNTRILLWPQYWAWRFSGVAASEVTSLGCHSDLWFPYDGAFSDLARARGWAERLPPLRRAGEVLGNIGSDLASATGLPSDCKVLCGLHDSNASLLAARGLPDLGAEFTVVSTGTWFVALQSGRRSPVHLDPARDTLANVDVAGMPTPSARFMGGREYELLLGDALGAAPTADDAACVVARNIIARPSFVPGCGPFPKGCGEVVGIPATRGERAAVASFYLALMTDACLKLVDADGPLLIEGRFAAHAFFPSALASLRRNRTLLAWSAEGGVALGAARLFWPDLPIPEARRVAPLSLDFGEYAEAWSYAASSR
jgi:sugar (pentulose or hexulose) kinase